MVSYLKLTNEKVDLKASWLTSAQQHCTIDWTPTWFAAPWHTELNLTPDITRSSHCHSSRLSVIATQYPVERPTSIGPHLPSRFDRSNTDILFSESSSSFEMRSEKNDFFFLVEGTIFRLNIFQPLGPIRSHSTERLPFRGNMQRQDPGAQALSFTIVTYSLWSSICFLLIPPVLLLDDLSGRPITDRVT